MSPRGRLVPLAVYLLLAANLLALWTARGPFVNGWDLFGATFGVLKLNEGSLADGVGAITQAMLRQRLRPVFTGGESLIYGLIPGLLNLIHPWLLWTHLLNLTLLVLISLWVVRVLGLRPPVYWACILASPALTSQAIVGLPDVASNAIPYSLAIGWVVTECHKRRNVLAGLALDVLVLAGAAAVAFNGYESGKTFFIVPALAALTLPRVPVLRRLGWLACALVIAWLVRSQSAGTTDAALSSVPHDPLAFARGMGDLLRVYLVDWYIDFPALLAAALLAAVVIDRERAFWRMLLLGAAALVSLNAFQVNGSFLVPHRFLLLGFISVLVVSRALSGAPPRWAALAMGGLLAVGAAYTTFSTTRFVLADQRAHQRNYEVDRVYPLPYNWARLDAHIWRDRINDAMTIADLVRAGSEPHVLFYGFSVHGEDTVNPQLLPARLLLSLGWETFNARVRLFDAWSDLFFHFPIRPTTEVRQTLAQLSVPFYVHVREPEYQTRSVVARYLNRSVVKEVNLGLTGFRSLRVERFEAPGPMPIAEWPTPFPPVAPGEPGLCLTAWRVNVGQDPLWPRYAPVAQLNDLIGGATSGRRPPGLTRGRVQVAQAELPGAGVAYLTGYFENPETTPRVARFAVEAKGEVVVLVNEMVVLDNYAQEKSLSDVQEVLLPPGPSYLRVLFASRILPGTLNLETTALDGTPIPWRCHMGQG